MYILIDERLHNQTIIETDELTDITEYLDFPREYSFYEANARLRDENAGHAGYKILERD